MVWISSVHYKLYTILYSKQQWWHSVDWWIYKPKGKSLNFGIIVTGTLYVMIPGTRMMQILYANNLDTEEQ